MKTNRTKSVRIMRLIGLLVVTLGWLGVGTVKNLSGDAPAKASAVAGTVKLVGAAPRSKGMSMTADPVCAKQHPGGMPAQDVVEGVNGQLSNVIVFVSKGLEGKTFDPPIGSAVIEQKGCVYEPHVVALRVNQKLRVVNDDTTSHNIHPFPANNREWNRAQPPGALVEESFSREEIAIPVRCNIHPWMRAYVAVFQHPYFQVTGKEGAFDLSNLPPGDYNITAWHEKLGSLTQQVHVAQGEVRQMEFVFRSQAGSM